MFDVAADAYDAYMGRWSRLLAAPFAELAGVRPGMRVLDVGCGTGALTDELVRRLGAGNVAGVDPSTSFVAAAARRHPGVDIREAAAEAMPFADGAFDAALAQLVVHFMADPVAGLSEARRVSRSGGAVAASVWDFAGNRGPLGIFWEAARVVRPDIQGEAHLDGTRDGHLVSLLEAAGLEDVRQAELAATIEHRTFEEWWAPFTRGAGPGGAFVASLDAEDQDRLRTECERRLTSGPINVTATAWVALGTAP
jgi:ubiquinone/menaquinone biosynthesis C-methylase UbiE